MKQNKKESERIIDNIEDFKMIAEYLGMSEDEKDVRINIFLEDLYKALEREKNESN